MQPNFNLLDTSAPERISKNMLAIQRDAEDRRTNNMRLQADMEDRQTRNALAQQGLQQRAQEFGVKLIPQIAQLLYADPSDANVDALARVWNQATGQDLTQLQVQLKGFPPEKRKEFALSLGQKYDQQFKVHDLGGMLVTAKPSDDGKLVIGDQYDPGISQTNQKRFELQGQRMDISHGLKGLSEEENMALFGPNGAVTEGRLDPNKVNSRTAKIFAQGELAQPGGTNFVQLAGDIGAIGKSIDFQEKQYGAMGSFVKNVEYQVDRFKEISKELDTFDTRLLNVPLRKLRGRVAGSPLQAKVDMYLAEISSEIGKLASGSTASVAELSVSAREKWEKIHDPNLSMADLISLLEETKHAAVMRMESVDKQLKETRDRRANVANMGKSGEEIKFLGFE